MISNNTQLRKVTLEQSIRDTMDEPNLYRRLQLFKELYNTCHKASQLYVMVYIKKTLNKIAEQQQLGKQQMDLPF
jgi:hypothetical protein